MIDSEEPRIVCLCGSTKHMEKEFKEANRDFTLAGYIVVSVGVDMKNRDQGFLKSITSEAEEKIKDKLDCLHRRKIDLADEVFIVNPEGAVGKSTQAEIEYATKTGKPVRYLKPLTS